MKNLYSNSQDLYNKVMREAPCKVAVDAGANFGGHTSVMLEHGFVVHAFEPVPAAFGVIEAKYGMDQRVILRRLALSDKTETIKDVTVLEAWTIGKVGMGGLSVKPEMALYPSFDMFTIALDTYWYDGWNFGKLGLLKLDVDGYEFKVLRGAEKTIRRWKPPILCEFGKYIAALGESPEEFVRYIFDLGYNVVSMDGWNTFTSWEEIQPQYPYDTTFDVMLMPRL